jgi:hypothetical protein
LKEDLRNLTFQLNQKKSKDKREVVWYTTCRTEGHELKEDLRNLTFQLNQNKSKDKREVVWYTTCRTEGHHKNECPTFAQYMEAGMSNPLPIEGLWCEIYKKPRHDPYHFPIMQKYQIVLKRTDHKMKKTCILENICKLNLCVKRKWINFATQL